MLGKVLRIDVDRQEGGKRYAIPPTNPFVGDTDVRDEIWALGIRNAWRSSFDRLTGDFYSGNVGVATQEINYVPADRQGSINFGWNCQEAGAPTGEPVSRFCADREKFTGPRFTYTQQDERMKGKSITGGFVYRGQFPELQGYYFCGDFFSGLIGAYPVGQTAGGVQVHSFEAVGNVSSFGESVEGELFVADYGGKVYQLVGELNTSVRSAPRPTPVRVFPNPAHRRLTVALTDDAEPVRLFQLFASDGRMVYQTDHPRVLDRQLSVALPDLPVGWYTIRLTDGTTAQVAQVLIN